MSLAERLQSKRHAFIEDVDDYSMCICGVPAETHAAVEPEPDGSGSGS